MKLWDVWEEGFAATGESGPAKFKGSVEAETFREACVKMYAGDKYFNEERLTWWGCKLFDNEEDARRSFG